MTDCRCSRGRLPVHWTCHGHFTFLARQRAHHASVCTFVLTYPGNFFFTVGAVYFVSANFSARGSARSEQAPSRVRSMGQALRRRRGPTDMRRSRSAVDVVRRIRTDAGPAWCWPQRRPRSRWHAGAFQWTCAPPTRLRPPAVRDTRAGRRHRPVPTCNQAAARRTEDRRSPSGSPSASAGTASPAQRRREPPRRLPA